MKRLIRDKRTKKFLTKEGTWTTDASAAEDFGNISSVIRAEQKHNLNGVELLMVMEEKPSSYDVVLPLGIHSQSRSDKPKPVNGSPQPKSFPKEIKKRK